MEDFCICFNIYGFLFLQVYGGKGEQKHRQIQFGGSAQQVIHFFLFGYDIYYLMRIRIL